MISWSIILYFAAKWKKAATQKGGGPFNQSRSVLPLAIRVQVGALSEQVSRPGIRGKAIK